MLSLIFNEKFMHILQISLYSLGTCLEKFLKSIKLHRKREIVVFQCNLLLTCHCQKAKIILMCHMFLIKNKTE